ncbi:MAG: glycosyltransferase [Terracidiphilus sp.]|jgi:glycosyltransferase involved in cell wall biosynthesis
MKLLHVICSTAPESGGPIEALLRLSEVLLLDGHEIAVVSLESEEEAAKRSFPFAVIGLGRGRGKYGYNPRLTHWLRQQAENFDAVILHGLWNYSSLGSWLALRKHSTPYYIFAHGMMDPWFRRKYPLKHFLKQVFWSLGEGRVLRDARAVLFTCEEEKVRARNVFFGHPYKERVVLFGTADPLREETPQTARFSLAFPALKGKRFLLYLSRIHPKKGCDLLIQAFAALQAELPPDLDLVMAGPDQVGWAPQLQALASRLGVASRIHWPGMLEGEIKWSAFRSAEAFILPSHQENFGIVVAEAMACSTPVLVSDKVNIWREVEAARAGLVEPDTADGTLNLIRRFCALSVEERARMAEAARQGFLQYFDVRASARDLIRIIGPQPDRPAIASPALPNPSKS